MQDLPGWLLAILPLDTNPKSIQRWRWMVGLTLLALWIALATSSFWVPMMLETAAHAQDVHQQLSKGLDKLSQSVDQLAQQLRAEEAARATAEAARRTAEKEKAIRDLRQQLYTTQRDACRAKDELRGVLTQQLNDLRSTYMALTGSEYTDIPCSSF